MNFHDWIPADMRWLFMGCKLAPYFEKGVYRGWTKEDDEILASFYPNFTRICELLPHRSRKYCAQRARRLGLNLLYARWSDQELKWLRKNYSTATWEEIFEYLPRRNKQAVARKACFHKIKRERLERPPVGIYLIDEIRFRAKQLNFSMRDLDEEAGGGTYFQSKRAKASPIMLRISALEAAVKAMGGRIEIRWSDE